MWMKTLIETQEPKPIDKRRIGMRIVRGKTEILVTPQTIITQTLRMIQVKRENNLQSKIIMPFMFWSKPVTQPQIMDQ
jgi:hypothetical protein